MGRGTDNDHLAVERPMPLRVASTDGLGADQPVVLGMTPDPEPVDAAVSRKAECSIVQANPGTVELATPK